MAWSANYTPTAQRRGLGELGVSGVNRDAPVGHQPGQHTGANIVCKFGIWATKGLRLMVVTTSADALHLLRLIFDTPSHERDERY